MRILPALALLCFAVGLVRAGAGDDARNKTGWKVEPFVLPGEGLTLKEIVPHGLCALLLVNNADNDDVLMHLKDGKIEPVRFPDGTPLQADFMWMEEPGEMAVLQLSFFDPDRNEYVLVIDGKARTILDAQGKPFSDEGAYFNNEDGRYLVQRLVEDGVTEVPLGILVENVVQPVTMPDSKQVVARLAMLEPQPDGRIKLRRAVPGDDGFDEQPELWLDGSKATPVEPPAAPADWVDAEVFETLYLPEQTLVVGGSPGECGVWVVNEGKTSWITDSAGKVLRHEWIDVGHLEGTTWLFAADHLDRPDKNPAGTVYRLDGGTAVRLAAPERKSLGIVRHHFKCGLPLAIVESAAGREQLWRIDGENIAPITAGKGDIVSPTDDTVVWKGAGKTWLKYSTHKGHFFAVLEGNQVIAPDVRVDTDEGHWFELDGEAFICGALHSKAFIARVDAQGLHNLKGPDGNELSGVSITAAQAGNQLYVSTISSKDEKAHWIVRK